MLTCLVVALGLAAPTAPGVAQAAPAPAGARATTVTIFIEGDSITSLYSANPKATGTRLKRRAKVPGFHAFLARKIRAQADRPVAIVTDAEGGSGFVRRGGSGSTVCTGTKFSQRLDATVKRQIRKAAIVIIEGGRNDTAKCVYDDGQWRKTRASSADLNRSVKSYLAKVRQLRKKSRASHKGVYVVTPWGGKKDVRGRNRISAIVKRQAAAHGFAFIDTVGVLDPRRLRQNTFDGLHPTRDGSQALARRMFDFGDRAMLRTIQRR